MWHVVNQEVYLRCVVELQPMDERRKVCLPSQGLDIAALWNRLSRNLSFEDRKLLYAFWRGAPFLCKIWHQTGCPTSSTWRFKAVTGLIPQMSVSCKGFSVCTSLWRWDLWLGLAVSCWRWLVSSWKWDENWNVDVVGQSWTQKQSRYVSF